MSTSAKTRRLRQRVRPHRTGGNHRGVPGGFEALRSAAETQGWRVELRKAGHWCFTSPAGLKVFTAATPRRDRPELSEKERGMKQADFQECAVCHKGMMHNNAPFFFRVTIDHMIMDMRAVQRAHGLEMMMNGNVAIAQVLGPNEDLAKRLTGETVLVCNDCSISPYASLAGLIEAGARTRDD